MKKRLNLATAIIIFFIAMYTLICLLPMLLVLIVSITDESTLIKEGIKIIPSKISFLAYRLLFNGASGALGRSYYVTIISTLIGTVIATTISAMAAYVLNDNSFKGKNVISFYFYFTMLFNGGMVPWYLINRTLGLYNNLWALIIPSLLFSPYNMFLIRNYMKTLPVSLMESARLDGANSVTIAFRIYLPLSVPVLAAVALFYGIGYWNSWWNAIMLIDNDKWYPLQFLLLKIRSALAGLKLNGVNNIKVPGQPLQNATTIVSIGPIIFLYPLLQRYFIKGLVVGAIKG